MRAGSSTSLISVSSGSSGFGSSNFGSLTRLWFKSEVEWDHRRESAATLWSADTADGQHVTGRSNVPKVEELRRE
jgi:hypothetical protein